jgi:hypothetical protein
MSEMAALAAWKFANIEDLAADDLAPLGEHHPIPPEQALPATPKGLHPLAPGDWPAGEGE